MCDKAEAQMLGEIMAMVEAVVEGYHNVEGTDGCYYPIDITLHMRCLDSSLTETLRDYKLCSRIEPKEDC